MSPYNSPPADHEIDYKKYHRDISAALTALLADTFALYVATKDAYWHMTGAHFRDYRLLLYEQGEELLATTDAIADRARMMGGGTIHSIGEISRLQRIQTDDYEFIWPEHKMSQLSSYNAKLLDYLYDMHDLATMYKDPGTASMIAVRIGEAERRGWSLSEITRFR